MRTFFFLTALPRTFVLHDVLTRIGKRHDADVNRAVAGQGQGKQQQQKGHRTEGSGMNERAKKDMVGAAAADMVAVELCPPSTTLIEACERGDVDAVVTLLDQLHLESMATNDDDAHDNNRNHVEGTGGGTVPTASPIPTAPATVVAAAAAAAVAGTENETRQLNSGASMPPSPPPPVAPVPGGWTAGEIIDRPDGLERLMTPLHVAAAGGHAALVGMLLERGASPLAEDVRGRVPYLLAANKDTRDAFRRARGSLQPSDRWDWEAARVPEPLTDVSEWVDDELGLADFRCFVVC